MGEFSELIKNFDKIRDYMRDFFVYGFKGRGDFTQKSNRTYDNERRRIESYLGEYIKWDSSKGRKRVFVSLDSSKISQNPLYSAWKSKSFTSNDIMLHFYLLDLLRMEKHLSIEELTDRICETSSVYFDIQTVRKKVNEYIKEGIIISNKSGKALCYSLSNIYLNNLTDSYDEILDAVKFYQEASSFGVIGSYILDNEDKKNDIFLFKHHFIVHTLEDKILLDILMAMKEKRKISFVNKSTRTDRSTTLYGTPLKIFVSTQTGRRYINIYNENRERFINHRLDYVKSVEFLEISKNYDFLKEKLEVNIDKCWGVSFGGKSRGEEVKIKFYIDEKREGYIINRINREGRGGKLERIDKNIYLFSKEIFDSNEIMFWAKSFTGRVMSVEAKSQVVVDKFYNDMRRMFDMYLGEE
ncbi:MAG: WYL domain-containing protein [Bacillota bacterium]|nr:WYL domain-containing protein [Bacillota bacterium]